MTNIVASSKVQLPFLVKVALFVAAFFVSLVAVLALSSTPSYAAGGGSGCTDPSNPMCAGTGGGGSGVGTANPLDSDTPTTPKPSSGSYGYSFNPDNYNFSVGCSTWGGSGSWRPNSSCKSYEKAISNASGREPREGWGRLSSWDNEEVHMHPETYFAGYTMFLVNGRSWDNGDAPQCGNSGMKSAYGTSWNKKVIRGHQTSYDFRWYKGAGWIRITGATVTTGEAITYTFGGCLYPTDRRSSVVCFWNYEGDSYYSKDRTRAGSSWEYFRDRGTRAGDPRPPSGGSGTTAPNCDRTGTANVNFATAPDLLGYYRVYVEYDYRRYSNLQWIAWGNQVVYNQWTAGPRLDGSATTWWAYSCRPNAANATEGAFNSQGSIPNRDNYLNPANCPQSIWQCQITSPTTVGMDRVAVANGSVNPRSGVTVMRNGEKIPTTFSTIRIIDQTGGGNVNVTNGETGPGVRGISNIEYRSLVKEGSSPFLGTNPNATQQYFKYYQNNKNESKTLERFNMWYSNANSNVDKALSFTWASDNKDAQFVVQRQWRVTGWFLVPQGGVIGGGPAPGAPQGREWKEGTYVCQDYYTSGGQRLTRGPLTANSNEVEVVRSVGDPTDNQ